jgi:hypothetical protein
VQHTVVGPAPETPPIGPKTGGHIPGTWVIRAETERMYWPLPRNTLVHAPDVEPAWMEQLVVVWADTVAEQDPASGSQVQLQERSSATSS